MSAFNTQQDLLDYIAQLERRITTLEQSAVRIDKTSDYTKLTPAQTRIIYDTTLNKLLGGNGTAWNTLW